MAIRIEPLSSGASGAPQGGGLRIRPLDDFLSTLPAASAPPIDFSAFFQRMAEAVPQGAASSPGGGDASSIGAPLGFGLNGSPTAAQVGAQFGHLAGPSPVSALFSSIVGAPNTATPAGLMGALFGAIPAPLTSLVGPIAAAMQQSAINAAMAMPEGFQGYFAANPIGLGFPARGRGSDEPAFPTPPSAVPSNAPAYSETPDGDDSDGTGGATAGGQADGNTGTGASTDSGPYHTGGTVRPGPPKGREVRARLLEGEYVVRPEAAKKHRPLLDAINRGESPKKLSKLIAYLEAE